MKKIHTILDEIIAAAKECGQVMLQADRSNIGIKDKAGKANFVTTYDCKIQEMLQAKLVQILPEAEFFGEEEDCQIDRNAEYIFVVDPIDGTTNFIKDYHMSCISIGLIRNGKRYLGVVHNPYLDETFYAISGEGAYMNGNAIHVQRMIWQTALFCLVLLLIIQNLRKHLLNWLTNIFRNALISDAAVQQLSIYAR